MGTKSLVDQKVRPSSLMRLSTQLRKDAGASSVKMPSRSLIELSEVSVEERSFKAVTPSLCKECDDGYIRSNRCSVIVFFPRLLATAAVTSTTDKLHPIDRQ